MHFLFQPVIEVKKQQNQDNYNRGRAREQFTSVNLPDLPKEEERRRAKSTAAGSEEFSLCSHTLKKLDTARF